ncbi:MAG: carboxynorspermidine decarboxylase [Methylococcaceae bacterium]|nr:carboxynorspermidine decarboxylase [Methylococcaceae bacterium]
MNLNVLKDNIEKTPAYVFDENIIDSNLSQLIDLKHKSGCQVLYSIKALPLGQVLSKAKDYLDGLSVSSLFEARLAREVLGDEGVIQITTPGLRDGEVYELKELCTHISFNSINQYHRFDKKFLLNTSLGLRINPKISFAIDDRFNPCRHYSKLGVGIDSLNSIPVDIEGLHFHTVFSHQDFLPLEQTVAVLKKKFSDELGRLKWLNLGGGYLYNQIVDQQSFINLVKQLKTEFDIEVYIEPGKSVVNNTGYLVSTIIDSFSSDGKRVLVLDTSVNHNPEVFEYQKTLTLLEENKHGYFSCILAGSSCLAGDLFGEYHFEKLLQVGDRIVFSNVGAYSLIKANRFNGYNLPDIYWIDKANHYTLIKSSSYENYQKQWIG